MMRPIFDRVVMATDLSSAWDQIVACGGELRQLGCSGVILTYIITPNFFARTGESLPAPAGFPKIMEFDRKFCPICQASERVILAVKARYPGQFEVEKLYIDEADTVFRRYKVAIVPTQVFLNAAGQEVASHEGSLKRRL